MPTANALQSSREAHRVVVVKPYLVSPQEWKVGVLLVAFVACLRVAFVSHGISLPTKVPWTASYGYDETKEDMLSRLHNYCHFDASVLCRDYFPTTCLRSQNNIDPTLTLIWGDNCMDKTFERLTKYKWWNVTIYDAKIQKELSKKSIRNNINVNKTLTDPETKLVLDLFVYTIVVLYKQIFDGEFVEISDPLPFPLDANRRLARHYFLAILDMFDKNSKTTTMTTNDVIKQVWTKGELFVLMRFAIQFVQEPAVKPMILEELKPAPYSKRPLRNLHSFYTLFLEDIIQLVVVQLEMKYDRGGSDGYPAGVHQSTTIIHAQNLTMIHQQQPLFPSHDQNTCMYKHYYASNNSSDSDGLITPQCRKGVKEAIMVFPYLPTELEHEAYAVCFDTSAIALVALGSSFIIMVQALWRLSRSKESIKKREDKRRRQLQQELEDPHLRAELEGKYRDGLREEVIAILEFSVANWDSKACAVRVVRLQVKRFRKYILALTVGWIFGVYWMRRWYSECAFGLYLDNIFLCGLVFVASYSIPMGLEEDETPNHEVGAVEMSDRRPLLLDDNHPS